MSPHVRTAASVLGIVAAFALVLYLAYGSGGGGSAGDPSPSAAVAGSPMQRPQVTAPPHDRPRTPRLATPRPTSPVTLMQGDPIDVPEDIALIVGETCRDCDYGAYSSIYRVYPRPDGGGVRIDRLFPPPGWGGLTITSVAVAWNNSVIALAACPVLAYDGSANACESEQTLYKSQDGAVTWANWGQISANAFVARVRHVTLYEGGIYEFDEAIIGMRPTPPDGEFTFTAHSGEPTSSWVSVPDATFQGLAPGVGPVWYSRPGEISHSNILLDIDNQSLASWDEPVDLRVLSMAHSSAREVLTFARTDKSHGGETQYLLETGIPLEDHRDVYSWPSHITVTGEAGPRQIAGNAEIDPILAGLPDGLGPYNVPVIVNVQTRVVSPISRPFLASAFLEHRYDVLMVQEGPFTRVSGADGCLEVRTGLTSESNVVECVAEGVLMVRGRGAFEVEDGGRWLAVATPSGRAGYAFAEHLEY